APEACSTPPRRETAHARTRRPLRTRDIAGLRTNHRMVLQERTPHRPAEVDIGRRCAARAVATFCRAGGTRRGGLLKPPSRAPDPFTRPSQVRRRMKGIKSLVTKE